MKTVKLLLIGIFILNGLLLFSQEIPIPDKAFTLHVGIDSNINFTVGENELFYDFLLQELDVVSIERGYFNKEVYAIQCQCDSTGFVDTVCIHSMNYTSAYRELLTEIFRELIFILENNDADSQDFQVWILLSVWKEMGNISLSGGLSK